MSFNFNMSSIITLIIGLLLCFCGYNLRRIGVAIIWFIVGYTISNQIIADFVSDRYALLTISIAIGLVLGVFGYSLEKIGIYIAVGLMTFEFLYGILPYTELINILIAVAGGILLATIAVVAIMPITVIVTALGGGSLVIQALGDSVIGISNNTFLIIEILLILFGILFQLKTSNNDD